MLLLKRKIFLAFVSINLTILMGWMLSGADILFVLVMLIWANMLFYALCDLGKRSMLFAFLVAFFVFLMGREVLQQFFSYKVEIFDSDVNFHSNICLLISLLTIMIGFIFFSRKNKLVTNNLTFNTDRILLKVSLYIFYITWVFAVVSKIVVARYISSNSYLDYYTDYSEYLSGNLILYAISKIELMMPVALSIFLACMPSKKQFKPPCFFYLVYLIVSLGSGQRSTFMLGILFLVVYFLFRNGTNPEEKWVKRSYIVLCIFAIPFLAVFFSWYSIWRTGETVNGMTFISGIKDFIYDQGVSINIIKRAYMYQDRIPSDQIYTLEFLHSGILARLLGITVYHGNTIEHALYGGSFTHALGYVVLGTTYLAGKGTGSSYIAELFQDFGYIGVCLGNIFYSLIIARINQFKGKQSIFWISVRFYIITQILWAPRGSYTGFISNLLAPSTVICFIIIFGVTKLIKVRFKERIENLQKLVN